MMTMTTTTTMQP